MNLDERVTQINVALAIYFRKNPSVGVSPAKEFMPLFIVKGIFNKDYRNGLPIRKVLRELDERGELDRIHYVHVERKAKNTSWYFGRPKTRPDYRNQRRSAGVAGEGGGGRKRVVRPLEF